jgi:predicted nucleic acid-binding protein
VILVDSSVWIDHLRKSDPDLVALLEAGEVVCHPFVIGELACGHLRQRARLLGELSLLPQAPVAAHAEAMLFLERHSLFGRGVGWADVHLLASAALAAETRVWSKDKRLMAAAQRTGLHHAGSTAARPA